MEYLLIACTASKVFIIGTQALSQRLLANTLVKLERVEFVNSETRHTRRLLPFSFIHDGRDYHWKHDEAVKQGIIPGRIRTFIFDDIICGLCWTGANNILSLFHL